MRQDAGIIRFIPLISGDKPMPSFPRHRVCSADGCRTRLSIYNSGQWCWRHEPVYTRRAEASRRN